MLQIYQCSTCQNKTPKSSKATPFACEVLKQADKLSDTDVNYPTSTITPQVIDNVNLSMQITIGNNIMLPNHLIIDNVHNSEQLAEKKTNVRSQFSRQDSYQPVEDNEDLMDITHTPMNQLVRKKTNARSPFSRQDTNQMEEDNDKVKDTPHTEMDQSNIVSEVRI